MSTNFTDYDALARRYLELWQEEMAKLAQDPNAAGTWANLFQGMMQNATAAWSNTAAAMKTSTNNGIVDAASNAQTRTQTAAAASGDGGVAIADVLRRIDARLDSIEQRLAALEAAPAPQRRTKSAKS
jgi:hypothetical protein